jgi:glycosyltransferase involved in cell wall biosynthesis
MASAKAQRALRAAQMLRRQGPREVGRRVVRSTYRRLGVADLDFPLLPGDLADSTRLGDVPRPSTVPRSRPLTIGWLTTPPSAGSGGHTTMFRMIEGLEAAGHRCVVLLYDRHQGDPVAQAAVIKANWPGVRAEVRSVDTGFLGLDGCVATGWPTAHVLASRCVTPLHRFYLVQDFEPFFFGRGSDYAFAEDTYRFGFRCISIGHMVSDLLAAQVGVRADVAEFGCDTEVYSLSNAGNRSGVVFYTKPDVPRRGYLLGVMALTEFHHRHPEQPIHVFGEGPRELPFPVVRHDRLTPAELNKLYNQTIAGLAMSFTNISLVAEEMLAAGTIAVVNDSPYSRADLDNPEAYWARATPGAMADALGNIVTDNDIPARAARAAAGVRKDMWRPAQRALLQAVEDEIYQ